jgi:hypothetical protein
MKILCLVSVPGDTKLFTAIVEPFYAGDYIHQFSLGVSVYEDIDESIRVFSDHKQAMEYAESIVYAMSE